MQMVLNIPDKLVKEAKAIGIYDEQMILQAFQRFVQEQQSEPAITSKQPQRTLGGAEGLVTYMADDFDAPLDDFRDYM